MDIVVVEIVQFNDVITVAPTSSEAVEVVINNIPDYVIVEVDQGGGGEGDLTNETLQAVTNRGNTTTNDIEILGSSGFILPVDGSSPPRRVRITANDDGSGNTQLILTDI